MNQPQLQREFEFTSEDFSFIAKLVHGKSGIVLADHKVDMVYARIARRLRQLGLSSFAHYCSLLQSQEGEAEMGNFVNALTTNLTSFFRESHHFDHLHQVLSAIAANPPQNRRLRLWSAACSSGAEPYSMAMICRETIPDIDQWDVKILATDIDTTMLAKARAGEYSTEEISNIPADLRSRYVTGRQMREPIRSLISFKPLNLIEPWPFRGAFDVVFCRNVVIYFNADTQRRLFASIAAHMHPHSWLYIGHSENLHNICDQFTLQGKTIYRRNA